MSSVNDHGSGAVACAACLTLLVTMTAGGIAPRQGNGAVGPDKCADCHAKLVEGWKASRHAAHLRGEASGCEHCHGPGAEHVAAGDGTKILTFRPRTAEAVKRATELCAGCHADSLDKMRWQTGRHAEANVSCADCHQFHGDAAYLLRKTESTIGTPGPMRNDPAHPTVEQAVTGLCLSCHRSIGPQLRQRSHHPLMENRMSCTACHDVHADDDAEDITAKCVGCHTDKRGPFVFEHEPVRATGIGEGCMSCHRSHGSPNPKLMRTFGRSVCMQCHTDIASDPSHQTRPGNCWRAGCHARIHGSNTSGVFLAQ